MARVFGALVDPLDNSLWLARPDGWIHFQPELQLWDQGDVPDGVQTIAFDADRSHARSVPPNPRRVAASAARRPGSVAGARCPPARSRRRASTMCSASVPVAAGQRSADSCWTSASGVARFTAAARSFDNLGWYLGTSGVGLLYLPDGAALPERLPFGLPSPVVGAVFDAPDGLWAATNRTLQDRGGAHLRRSPS